MFYNYFFWYSLVKGTGKIRILKRMLFKLDFVCFSPPNVSNVSPCYRLQFFTNCSGTDPFPWAPVLQEHTAPAWFSYFSCQKTSSCVGSSPWVPPQAAASFSAPPPAVAPGGTSTLSKDCCGDICSTLLLHGLQGNANSIMVFSRSHRGTPALAPGSPPSLCPARVSLGHFSDTAQQHPPDPGHLHPALCSPVMPCLNSSSD